MDRAGESKSTAPGSWTFRRNKDGSWRWRQMNLRGVSRASAAGFAALGDCIANAIYHGYVPPMEVQEGRAAAA